MKTKIKTLDITAKEWFDKVNGNSYFSCTVTVNYGMKGEQTIKLPFQYGYGDLFRHKAFEALQDHKLIPGQNNTTAPWCYYDDNNIIARHTKYENCLKRDLKALVS